MTREKVEGSPLSRKRMVIGAIAPETQAEPEREPQAAKRQDIKTSEHKNVKTAAAPDLKRTTFYLPEALHIRLKVYAARHKEDMSQIVVRELEKLLDGEE
jgi:hypothetical protein